VGIIADITEQKMLEEQLRQSYKMESIGTLAGGIAHEFNNMLGIIIGHTELAIDDIPEWNPAAESLREIKTASLRARDVVRKLLSFARKTPSSRKPVHIGTIVKESANLLRKTIPASIEMRLNLHCTIETILADPTEISQVLLNLCTNAAHAMESGGKLTVSLQPVAFEEGDILPFPKLKQGRYVHLRVSDTGCGIPAAHIDRIFDPFFTTKDVSKGTGLGLSVVLGIVKDHQGQIFVHSAPGKGTVFDLYFPSISVVEEQPQSDSPELPGGQERILFVDDEPAIAGIAQQLLQNKGYHVDIRTDPRQALALFESDPQRYDLVITDMAMPHLTGIELALKMLEKSPHLPVILISGFSDRVDRHRAMAMGIRMYIEKPLDFRKLALAVREALDQITL